LGSSADFSQNAFNNNNLPSIFAFPKGEKFWRIDWFGDFTFSNRMIRRTQPSILVHLSRIIDDHYPDDPSVLLSPESTGPAKFQRKAWVSVGTLPVLRIGDIWRDGKLVDQPAYQLESFSDLQIDRQTTHLVKAGLNLDDQGFLLPITEHPWHMQCTHSYCVMVDLPDDRRLMIPCVELIRFYFGSSNGLVTKLFLPPLERKVLYGDAHFDKSNGRLALQLAERIHGASASDIGRLHLDPVAWRAALHIGTTALAASLSKQNVYPQAFFPFEGRTTLVAAGKWLSLGDKSKATFVVYNLRSCSHPFPFRSLRYETKVDPNRPPRNGKSGPLSPDDHPRHSSRDSKNQDLVEMDASNRLASRTKQIWQEPRFPDLRNKPVWKDATITSTESNTTTAGSGSAIEHAAVGSPGSEHKIRSIDLAMLSRLDIKRPVPGFLQEILDELKQLENCDIQLLTKSEQDGWTVPVTVFADEDGEIDSRFCIADEVQGMRLRRAAVFALRRDRTHASIVLIESLPVHVKLYIMSGDNPQEVWSTLQCAAADFICKTEPRKQSILDLINTVLARPLR
jgi:hypothetical protein